jgi:predicted nuclease of predicted toxin-antitoxin system
VKVLLDTCISGTACAEIASAGHDVLWTGDWTKDPGDDEILAQAHAEARVLVTLDKDFGELAIVRERPHAGIVRLVGIRAGEQARVCLAVLARYGDALTAGAIVTVEPGRVRVRAAVEP